MKIININEKMIKKVENFLLKLDSIKEVETKILGNGVVILDDNDICGYMTFEEYVEYGLIRYFIFQKDIDFNNVIDMFHQLTENAREKNIESFIAIGKNQEVVDLFNVLEFYQVDSDNIVINNQRLQGTNLEKATILKYDILELSKE